MKSDTVMQVAVSFLAHVAVFFAANQFFDTGGQPLVDVTLNTTHTSETQISVKWKLAIPENVDISALQISISCNENPALYTSVDITNTTVDQHTFVGLQPLAAYNACLIVHASSNQKPAQMSKCIPVKTQGTTLSHLKLFTSTSDDSGDKTAFWFIMAVIVFALAAVGAYHAYWRAYKTRMTVLLGHQPYRGQCSGLDDTYDYRALLESQSVEYDTHMNAGQASHCCTDDGKRPKEKPCKSCRGDVEHDSITRPLLS